jgi:Zn-dependent protease with chaperone function
MLADRLGLVSWFWFPAVHLAASPLVLWRPFEMLLVLCSTGMGRAGGVDRERLGRLTAEVAERCGVTPRRWIFAVERVDGLNAATSGRHVLSVTPRALTLPDPILASVLAHELGHQVGGDSYAKGLRWWAIIPMRALTRMTRLFAWVFLGFSGAVAVVGVVLIGVMYLALLPLALLYPLHAWLERRNEFAADEFAARAGFGPGLAALLRVFADTPRSRGLRRLLDSHPHPADRVTRLDNYVG